MFVKEVMEMVELDVLKDSLVGLPGVDGLSSEQRKRLSIAVEMVANPSIIFMDEPTSGLDARAAAIVMRAVRNTVDTGRTVVCTIHQPSINIFEAFDELLLMKMGGKIIYAGPLGHHSQKLIEYFEALPGIPKITEGYNPATWMLEVTTHSIEASMNIDFAEVYAQSPLYQYVEAVYFWLANTNRNKIISPPHCATQETSGTNQRIEYSFTRFKGSIFPYKIFPEFLYSVPSLFMETVLVLLENPQYNAIRFFITVVLGLLFGTMFWQMGDKTSKQQDILNLLGAIYGAIFFLGVTNAMSMQPAVEIERTVFYRERAAGMYSAMAYACAQVSIEMLYVLVQGLLYSLLLFPIIGFTWHVDAFFWFCYFILMCFAYFALFGMMIAVLTPTHLVAGVVSSFFYSFWNLFSGFLIPRLLIPVWWRWYYWGDPVAWTIYGIVASQLGKKENLVQIPGEASMTVKHFLKYKLGFEYSFLGYVALAHLGFALLFLFVFAYSIKYLNFQKR